MKLWQKPNTTTAEFIEKFTVGNDNEWDLRLAEFDIIGSVAHTQMLHSIGLLSSEEFELIQTELAVILAEIKSGKFIIDDGVEDIHSQIEGLLTQRIGEAGKKIHSGRSRNDQVLLDIKLYLKEEIKQTVQLISTFFETLLNLSESNKNNLMPGYTHLQLAMPSSFGLWFGAYAESLTDDMELMRAAFKIINRNPLGSGAGYGSSLPLDRAMTTQLLGFESMNYNVVYAQMTRGKAEKTLAMAMSSVAATLSKFAYDICLYLNQNFAFISFPDSITTGSSIMPHKKNPDVFELIRGKCNKIQALPNELTLLLNNLPSGYHRDFQLTKESLFPAIQELKNCIVVFNESIQSIIIDTTILDDEKYNYLFSVEAVNEKVNHGTPFRQAYQEVAKEVLDGNFKPERLINHTHQGSLGNLCNNEIKERMQTLTSSILTN